MMHGHGIGRLGVWVDAVDHDSCILDSEAFLAVGTGLCMCHAFTFSTSSPMTSRIQSFFFLKKGKIQNAKPA
jgi:hypothetical protein